jgi:hypothetical protein
MEERTARASGSRSKPSKKPRTNRAPVFPGFSLLLLDLADRGSKFLRNVGQLALDQMEFHARILFFFFFNNNNNNNNNKLN